MGNPTRDQLLERLAIASRFKDLPMMEMCNFALRALDMRAEILAAYAEHPGRAMVHRVMGAVEKFDEGADNSEEDPMLTEGRRRGRRCRHN